MRVTFPAKFTLDLNILIICSEGHNSWIFTFCKFSCLLVHFRFTTFLCFLIYFYQFFAIFLLRHFTFILFFIFPSYFWFCGSLPIYASTSRPATLSHTCVWPHHWLHQQTTNPITGVVLTLTISYLGWRPRLGHTKIYCWRMTALFLVFNIIFIIVINIILAGSKLWLGGCLGFEPTVG